MINGFHATALNAITNASTKTVTVDDIKKIIATGDGEFSHVMALFFDCSLETLLGIAAEANMTIDGLLNAFGTAREKHAAANVELDEMLLERARRDR